MTFYYQTDLKCLQKSQKCLQNFLYNVSAMMTISKSLVQHKDWTVSKALFPISLIHIAASHLSNMNHKHKFTDDFLISALYWFLTMSKNGKLKMGPTTSLWIRTCFPRRWNSSKPASTSKLHTGRQTKLFIPGKINDRICYELLGIQMQQKNTILNLL